VEPPIETTIAQDVKQRDAPPPPPPPKMERPPVEIPPPDVTINIPVEQTSTAITNVTTQHVAAPPPAPPRPVARTGAVALTKLDPANFYPPTSIRMNETGSTLIKYCWGTDGKLTGTPTVEKSSGSSRLDEAAVRLGTQERMKPGTVDGQPVAACASLSVKFQLN
jgi:protein TonB